jgi:urease accessory protein
VEWLSALQFLDSSFTTGAYVHSFGLESLEGHPLESALRQRLSQSLAQLELVFARLAYTEDLFELDGQLHVIQLAREPREASAAIGRNLLRSVTDLVSDNRLAAFAHDGRHQHHAVAFGAVAAAIGLPLQNALEAYAFGSIRAEVSAAQRLGWLGQREAQRLLHTLKPAIVQAVTESMEVQLEEAGAFTPGWDIASMRHERATARMFAS